MQKLRIGVFMGGKSIEKEVSLNSGRTVCDHLDTNRYTIVPIFQREDGTLFILPWQFLHRGKISDFVKRLDTQAQKIIWDDLPSLVDFIYHAMPGRYSEDGVLQGIFELLQIPYLGSGVLTSAICMDKIVQKNILKAHNITVPKDITLSVQQIKNIKYKKNILQKLSKQHLDFPLIVKPHKEGSSLGVSVACDESTLLQAIHFASTVHPEIPQAILVEEKIEGMEFSCIILWDYKKNKPMPLPPTEIVPEKGSHIFDYDQKYMPGRATKFTPARGGKKIIDAIHKACLKTVEALEIKTIARIDGFVKKDGSVVIVDPNTLSGMAPNSFLFREAAELGMGHRQLINHLIETELSQYGMLQTIMKLENKKAMNKKRTRIAVLFGGKSNEREISLESGRNVCYKLANMYDVIPLFVTKNLHLYKIDSAQLVRNSTKEIEAMLSQVEQIKWQSLPNIVDFVFNTLHGGEGENGSVQGMLEMLELPYNGSSVLTSALCMDKYKTATYLKQTGFEVPNHFLLSQVHWQEDKRISLEKIKQQLSFPLIVKPHDDGCSVMVEKITTEQELVDAINKIFESKKNYALIEEFITGMELTVGVIGNEEITVFPPSQTVTQKDILSIEEKFLPGEGENQTPAPLTKEASVLVQKIVGSVYQTLACKGYARIDCFYQEAQQNPTKKPRVVILEINTLPGLTPATCLFHQAAEVGIKPEEFLDQIIQFGFKEHTKSPVSGVLQDRRTEKKEINNTHLPFFL